MDIKGSRRSISFASSSRLRASLAVALGCLLLTGCSPSSSRTADTTLRIIIGVEPSTLNPILQHNTIENFVDGLICQGRYQIKPATPFVPGSEIAGVVADIRRQGFEVLLMLEATIGLNEVEQQPAGALQATRTNDLPGPEQEGTFTPQDLHFLKSLRISLSGDAHPQQGSVADGQGEQEDA